MVSPVTCRGRSFQRKQHPPQQVQHRQVLHHLGRRDERGEDDPRLATVNDVMVVVPQIQAATAVAHEGGIGIGDAGPEVGHPPVAASHHRPIRPSGLAEPVVATRCGFC